MFRKKVNHVSNLVNFIHLLLYFFFFNIYKNKPNINLISKFNFFSKHGNFFFTLPLDLEFKNTSIEEIPTIFHV
jgi:hypothetical protein